MIIIMKPAATEKEIAAVTNKIKKYGLEPHIDRGVSMLFIGIRGDTSHLTADEFLLEGVKEVKRISRPYKEVSMEFHPRKTVVKVGEVSIGEKGKPVIIAGPCAVEDEDSLFKSAHAAKKLGVDIFRAGAFKPRTSPYAFQGLGEEGLRMLRDVKKETGLPIISEAMCVEHLDLFEKYDIDIIQIGARNMQNYDLLKVLGKMKRAILLKRGLSSTVEEFLLSAEYILTNGNRKVVLCERGIRTFETAYRNVLDLNCVALIKNLSHLPILVDPSHGTGKRELVIPMSMASLAAGADGLLIEAHIDPSKAKCDANQQLNMEQLKGLMKIISNGDLFY